MTPQEKTTGATTGSFGLEEFSQLIGTSAKEMPDYCRDLISQGNFQYQVLSDEAKEQVLLDVLERTDSGEFTQAGWEGQEKWESIWSEKLSIFQLEGGTLSSLLPTYYGHHSPILRLNQAYILPEDPGFHLNWYRVFQHWLFTAYFEEAPAVYEFGCGSGINLVALAERFPEKRFVGLDWSKASNQSVSALAQVRGWNMEGRYFNFFAPDQDFKLDAGSVVLTVQALEQTGDDYEDFLQYLLSQSPSLCVNIEPVLEWYDENNLIDNAAIRFHKKRKYLEGFPTRLKELEREGQVEIVKMRRTHFGTLFTEGYSQIIWRPLSSR